MTEEAEAVQTAQAPEKLAHPILRALAGISWFIGIIGVFNLVANAQDLMELSETIHLLVDWWHYFTKILFSWLRIDLPNDVRDAVIVLALMTGAGNLYYLREHGETWFSFAFRLSKGEDSLYDAAGFGVIGKSWLSMSQNALVWTLVMSCVTIIIRGIFGEAVVIGTGTVLILSAVVPDIYSRISGREIPRVFMFLPKLLLSFAFFGKEIAYSAGAVVLLLAVNLFMEKVVDPFAPYLENLPRPPIEAPAAPSVRDEPVSI